MSNYRVSYVTRARKSEVSILLDIGTDQVRTETRSPNTSRLAESERADT